MDRNEKGEDLNGSDDDNDDNRKMPAVDHPNQPGASQTADGVNNDDGGGIPTMPSENQDGASEAAAVDETELDTVAENSSIDNELSEWKLSKVSSDDSQCGLLNELPQEGGGDGVSNKAKASPEVATTERTEVVGGGAEDVMNLSSQDPVMGPEILQDTLERFAGASLDDRQLIAVVRSIVGQMSRVYTFGTGFRTEFLTILDAAPQRRLLDTLTPEMFQNSFRWEALLTHLRSEGKQEPMERNEKGEDLNGSDDDNDDDRKMPAVVHPNQPGASQTADGVNYDDDDDDDGIPTTPSENQDGASEAAAVDELNAVIENSLIDTKFLDGLFPDGCIDNSQCGLLEELPHEGDGSTEVVLVLVGGNAEDVMALLSQDPVMGPAILQDTLERFAGASLDDRELIAVVRWIVEQMPGFETLGTEFREEFLTRLDAFCLLEQSQNWIVDPFTPQMRKGSFRWEALLTHLRRERKQEPTAKKGDNKSAKKPKKGTPHKCTTCGEPRKGHVCTGPPVPPTKYKCSTCGEPTKGHVCNGPPVIPVETKDCETQTEEEDWKTNETSDSFEVSNVEEAENIVETEAVGGGEECKEEIIEPEYDDAEVEEHSTEATVIEEAKNGGVDGPKEDQPASKDKKKE